jgi:hypothetical protein
MMTVCKCQALVVAGRWLNPRVKLMAVMEASGSIDPLHVCAVQNFMAHLEGFHHGSPDADDESYK